MNTLLATLFRCFIIASMADIGKITEEKYGTRGERMVRFVSWVLFAGIVVLLAILQAVFFRHAGAFWRDEVSTILVSRFAHVSDLYAAFERDWSPALFDLLLRSWTWVGLGAADGGLRLLGAVVYFSIIAAIWRGARAFDVGPPIVAVALVAFNGAVFYWGSSIRAYGLAAALAALLVGSIWRLISRPSWTRIAAATAVAVMAAQSSYQNTYIIFAACAAGAMASLARSLWRRAGLSIAVGVVAAASLLPYVPVVLRVREWSVVTASNPSLKVVLARAAGALGSGSFTSAIVWADLMAFALIAPLIMYLRGRGEREPGREPSPGLYAAVFICIATAGLISFLAATKLITQQWYYIPFMAAVAVAIEASFCPFGKKAWIGTARAALACLVIATSISALWDAAHMRRTNLDLVAKKISAEAGEKDMALVSPFWLGLAFKYYYDGKARWMTLPPLSGKDIDHPYPAIKEILARSDAAQPAFDAIRETLEGGGRVWLVGDIHFLPPGVSPPESPPAPHPQFGWDNAAYAQIWAMQAGSFVQGHALKGRPAPALVEGPVNPFENLPVLVVEGRR